jgi:hypothetical protein
VCAKWGPTSQMDESTPMVSERKPLEILQLDDSDDSEVMEPEVYYYVLQNGSIAGPFTIKKVVEMAITHTVKRSDFVQAAGSSEWLLLPLALDPGTPAPDGTSPAPDWKTIASWSWLRLRYNLDEKSLAAGCICLAIAVLGVLVSQWSAAFWGPMLLPPIFAVASLLRKKRYVAGLLLLAGVAAVPLLAQKWAGFFE